MIPTKSWFPLFLVLSTIIDCLVVLALTLWLGVPPVLAAISAVTVAGLLCTACVYVYDRRGHA